MRELRRIGKRIAIGVDGDLWLVLHLMIAGRLHWRPPQAKLAGRNNLAAFDFPDGSLLLTEAGTKRRASLHVLAGEEALRSVDPGGIDVFASDLAAFRAALTAENRTLKRALTDPRLLSGIGNAYSDEILHAAQLSPITLTHKLQPEEWERLFAATRDTLTLWIDRLRAEASKGFPEKVTAFREEHGRSRPLRTALPAVRRKNSAHSLRRQRNELLRALPDRRQSARRPRPVPPTADRTGRARSKNSKPSSAASCCAPQRSHSVPMLSSVTNRLPCSRCRTVAIYSIVSGRNSVTTFVYSRMPFRVFMSPGCAASNTGFPSIV